jgi:hypothetical protein
VNNYPWSLTLAVEWDRQVGLGLSFGGGVLLTALLIPPLIARFRAEERLLRSQFGGEYDAYRSRTSRLIPGFYQHGGMQIREISSGAMLVPEGRAKAFFRTAETGGKETASYRRESLGHDRALAEGSPE